MMVRWILVWTKLALLSLSVVSLLRGFNVDKASLQSELGVEEKPQTNAAFIQENLLEGTHRCGRNKCFYRLKDNPNLGYVAVGTRTWGKRSILETNWTASLDLAYQLASETIEKQYGMHHVFVEAPKTVAVSPEFQTWLNTNKTAFDDQRRPERWNPQYDTPTLLVQMVRVIEDHEAFFFGTPKSKLQHQIALIDDWLTHRMLGNPPDLPAIRQTFAEDYRKLTRLLQEQPCLWNDFQIYVRSNGQIVHFDVDRCFEDNGVRVADVTPHLQQLDGFAQFVLQALKTGELPDTVANDPVADGFLQHHRQRVQRARVSTGRIVAKEV